MAWSELIVPLSTIISPSATIALSPPVPPISALRDPLPVKVRQLPSPFTWIAAAGVPVALFVPIHSIVRSPGAVYKDRGVPEVRVEPSHLTL